MISLLWAGALLFGGGLTVTAIITLDYLRQEVKKRHSNAFKIMILSRKKNAVDVGIFNRKNQRIDEIKYTSSEGVSDALYRGLVLYV